ncbi:SAM-dependent methyltransferase [Streptomyces sp. NWU49]|uniref:class I SAM-dependent methyltransferase n=1 Tax=Streptomyces sp. NWU49 TaxID=2201153 RepID=UPI000D6849E9|nr:class I SAM-dependent methyltransferase [Streptomyces sp. NWU49]PWJ05412.1 SAM-dependent methyltransferase [Streptomyces sp. NWU49]
MAEQLVVSDTLHAYLREVSLREDEVLSELREFTAQLPAGAAMQVSAEEGQLLALLVRLTGAVNVLEIGTFTGYSTLCMARALPPEGRLTTCDITDRWPDIAARYWRKAAVDDRIELRIGDARETLDALRLERGAGHFDLVFIDADKSGYLGYYEKSLDLLRPGGLVVVDNTLFFGRVVDPGAQDADTVAIREFNRFLHGDERVDVSMLSMADGITLARKRTA